MSPTGKFAVRQRASERAALGWEIDFGIWVSSIVVAVFAALGNLRPEIFNEVLG